MQFLKKFRGKSSSYESSYELVVNYGIFIWNNLFKNWLVPQSFIIKIKHGKLDDYSTETLRGESNILRTHCLMNIHL